jgi:hypothetical protein
MLAASSMLPMRPWFAARSALVMVGGLGHEDSPLVAAAAGGAAGGAAAGVVAVVHATSGLHQLGEVLQLVLLELLAWVGGA